MNITGYHVICRRDHNYYVDPQILCIPYRGTCNEKRIRFLGASSCRSQDTFQGSMVRAVKVLHTHYSLLGVQESDCVRRINLADPYDTSGTLRFCVSLQVNETVQRRDSF